MSASHPAKRAAATAAADLVEDGMCLGLGSGSTFLLVIERLGQRIAEEGLKLSGVPTSNQTAEAAAMVGIEVLDLASVETLDLAIDGADEIDGHKNMIKGGGAAHTREKIVAATAREMVVVVDDSKLVDTLGLAFKLPVEILEFGWRQAQRAIASTGCEPVLRAHDDQPVRTDNGNLIVDCSYENGIEDAAWLHDQLNALPGVLDNGLFAHTAGRVIVGDADGKVRTIP